MAAVAYEPQSDRRLDRDTGKRRQAVLVAFLGAGLSDPPSTALVVQALADARRAVAAQPQHSPAIDQWLASEMRLHGIRENAAVLALLETPGHRERTAQVYRQQHPDRLTILSDLLAVLDRS
jgi:hypothetical protein